MDKGHFCYESWIFLVDVSLTNSRPNMEKQSQQNYFIYENKLK